MDHLSWDTIGDGNSILLKILNMSRKCSDLFLWYLNPLMIKIDNEPIILTCVFLCNVIFFLKSPLLSLWKECYHLFLLTITVAWIFDKFLQENAYLKWWVGMGTALVVMKVLVFLFYFIFLGLIYAFKWSKIVRKV